MNGAQLKHVAEAAIMVADGGLTPAFQQWIDTGKQLASARRDVDWKIADWLHSGKDAGYLNQAGFDFLSDNLGIAPKRLKDIQKAASVFPPHMRDTSLSIEYHTSVSDLPAQEALSLLKDAKAKHWTPEQTKYEAQARCNHETPYRQHGGSDTILEGFIRHWNRLPRSVREDAAEMIAGAGFGEIEP